MRNCHNDQYQPSKMTVMTSCLDGDYQLDNTYVI